MVSRISSFSESSSGKPSRLFEIAEIDMKSQAAKSTKSVSAGSSHAQMHVDHTHWLRENKFWRDELRAWQTELASARVELTTLEKSLAEHEKTLETHAAAVRLYEQAVAEHEQALAGYEQGEAGEKLVVLAREHQVEDDKQAELRQAHERLKKRQHTLMAHWSALFKAMVSKE